MHFLSSPKKYLKNKNIKRDKGMPEKDFKVQNVNFLRLQGSSPPCQPPKLFHFSPPRIPVLCCVARRPNMTRPSWWTQVQKVTCQSIRLLRCMLHSTTQTDVQCQSIQYPNQWTNLDHFSSFVMRNQCSLFTLLQKSQDHTNFDNFWIIFVKIQCCKNHRMYPCDSLRNVGSHIL